MPHFSFQKTKSPSKANQVRFIAYVYYQTLKDIIPGGIISYRVYKFLESL
jgi:hypothetical protein